MKFTYKGPRRTSFADYLMEVKAAKMEHHEWRVGQTFFNVLYEERPDLSEQIRGHRNLDPFHQDGNIPAFLAWVEERW